jgi:chemotaxis-related protein WspB
MALIRLLFFHSGGLRLALDLRDILRVLPLPLLHGTAGAPPFAAGYFDYRGRAVAAVRLARLLGAPDDAIGLYSPLILLAKEEPPIALSVARIEGVLPTDTAAILPIGGDATFNGCISGQFSEKDGIVYLIRADALLLSAERARLVAFAAIQQARLDAVAEASHAA